VTRRYLPGDVALSRSDSFTGWCIRLGTRSRINHTRWVVDEAGGTLEAMSKGAVWGHVRKGDLVIRPPMTDDQREQVPTIARELHGTKYGFLGVLALGLAQFGIPLPIARVLDGVLMPLRTVRLDDVRGRRATAAAVVLPSRDSLQMRRVATEREPA
jgi:hypothetical protein